MLAVEKFNQFSPRLMRASGLLVLHAALNTRASNQEARHNLFIGIVDRYLRAVISKVPQLCLYRVQESVHLSLACFRSFVHTRQSTVLRVHFTAGPTMTIFIDTPFDVIASARGSGRG